jgi:hypothetical protein
MQANLKDIFQKAKYEPDENLAFSVWQTLITREKREAKFKLWSFSFIGIFSFVGLIPTFQTLLSNLSHSGFYEYFSLIFSDGGAMLNNSKEFSLSLAESLPIMSIIFTLSMIFVCFLSLKYIFKQIIKNQLINASVLLSIPT